MAGSMLHTVTRRNKSGWVSIRMYEDQEICRGKGKTRDESRDALAAAIKHLKHLQILFSEKNT
jgi:hypothetical protein